MDHGTEETILGEKKTTIITIVIIIGIPEIRGTT
jgi:hypothetical protein